MKEQFLQELKEALAGQVTQRTYNDTIRYYEGYIDEQVRSGKSEEEVMNALGSGRLIAKTVIDTAQASGEATGVGAGVYEESGNAYEEGASEKVSVWTKIKGIAVLAGIIIVALAIIGIVASVVWALIPVVAIIFLVYWLYNYFQ